MTTTETKIAILGDPATLIEGPRGKAIVQKRNSMTGWSVEVNGEYLGSWFKYFDSYNKPSDKVHMAATWPQARKAARAAAIEAIA